MDFQSLRFINESIDVEFTTPPLLQKKPFCPNGFTWRDENFLVLEVVSEWRDYSRHGRMARNMQPQHADVASNRGSWGVGTFYFRVRTQHNRYFDIFYDRTPKDVDDRKGNWYLYREIAPLPLNDSQ
jgi:hypothetical protein